LEMRAFKINRKIATEIAILLCEDWYRVSMLSSTGERC
jgi:hypothetical protein